MLSKTALQTIAVLSVLSLLTHAQAQEDSRVQAKCLLTFFMEMQLARAICKTPASDIDAAVDAAVPKIAERLIREGKITHAQLEEKERYAIANWSAQSARICTDAESLRMIFSAKIVAETVQKVLEAESWQLTDDCI